MNPLPDRFVAAFADRYAIERELGQGGMATVYLGRDLKHDRQVAIKVLSPELAAAAPGRFLREIQTIARLQHPHILGLIDSGEVEHTAYYVMPFIDGGSLRDRLDREKQLPIADAVRIASEIASGLDYAHRHGVVHRDIKPENVLLHEGRALVTDFGIALAAAGGDATRMTATGLSLGTPHYMSPEQAMGERDITGQADVYALGTLLYEMLLGEPPFTGANAQAIVARVITERPASIVARRGSVSEALEAVVLTALEKLPADRFASAAELGDALAAAAMDELPAAGVRRPPRATRAERPLATGTFRLSDDTCRRLSRAAFDPRLIGSQLSYLDNGVASDVLVCWIAACGRGGDQFDAILRRSKYRGIAPTLRGFEPGAEWRPAFSVDDHIVVVREALRSVASRIQPRALVIAGFSSGGDFALRLAGAPDPDARLRIDGCLTLGANLSLETCFLTSRLATLERSDDAAMLSVLRSVTDRAATLDEWVDICEYVIRIVPVFRNDVAPLRAFAAGISAPYERKSIVPFAEWYRAAAAKGCKLGCVFEDTSMYRDLVRDLQLRNLDDKLLGDHYEELSVVTEASTHHFDLIDPERVARQLDALVARIT